MPLTGNVIYLNGFTPNSTGRMPLTGNVISMDLHPIRPASISIDLHQIQPVINVWSNSTG